MSQLKNMMALTIMMAGMSESFYCDNRPIYAPNKPYDGIRKIKRNKKKKRKKKKK